MDDFRKDELWELLGTVPRRKPSPWLASKIQRELRRPHTSWWGCNSLSLARRQMWVSAAAMALLLAMTPVVLWQTSNRRDAEHSLFVALDTVANQDFEEGLSEWIVSY